MRFAVVITLTVLNFAVFAVTNATVTVSSSATNAILVKVSKKTSRSSRLQCEAMTLSGNRCKRHAAEGCKYCSQHTAILRKREKEPKAK